MLLHLVSTYKKSGGEQMKKEYKVLVLSFVFVFMFSSLAHAMSWEQFIETFGREYIYRVDYPNGNQEYFSAHCELEFRMEGTYYGNLLESGKALSVYKTNPALGDGYGYRLTTGGNVAAWGGERLDIIDNPQVLVGFEGDIDIYRWNGYGFFLPEPSAFLRGLGGPIRTILLTGFGIVSVMLLVKLLAVYWKRFVHRSL